MFRTLSSVQRISAVAVKSVDWTTAGTIPLKITRIDRRFFSTSFRNRNPKDEKYESTEGNVESMESDKPVVKSTNRRLLSSMPSRYLNVRFLHVESALRGCNERVTVDFQEELQQDTLQHSVDVEWEKLVQDYPDKNNQFHLGYQHGLNTAKIFYMSEVVGLKNDLDASAPLYCVVMVRRKIENWEALFGLHYPYNNRKPDRKSIVTKVYDFHYDKWCWIWDNCRDQRWIAMKTDLEAQTIDEKPIDKEHGCSTIASLLSLVGHDIHFPGFFRKIKKEKILEILGTDLGIDEISLKCVNVLYRK